MIILDWVGGFCTVTNRAVIGFSCFAVAELPLTVSAKPPEADYIRSHQFPIVNPALQPQAILDYRAERLWRGEPSDR